MESSDGDSYEWAIARVPQLEVDLAGAMGALDRVQADNATLKDVHTDLVNAYRRLQEQHERLRIQLRREQEERHLLAEDAERQQACWRSQLEARGRELEELQLRQPEVPPREAEAMRLRVAEEVEADVGQRVRQLEARLAAEQQRGAESQRQARVQQSQAAAREEELREEVADVQRTAQSREQTLQRQLATLQASTEHTAESEASLQRLRGQVQDLEARNNSLQSELLEHEAQRNRERTVASAELRASVEDVGSLRKKHNELQLRLAQEESRSGQLAEEIESARREQMRAASELESARREQIRAESELEQGRLEAQAGAVAAAPPSNLELEGVRFELVALRAAQASEREQHVKERHAAALDAVRKERDAALDAVRKERDVALAAAHSELERRGERVEASEAQVLRLTQVNTQEKDAWRRQEEQLQQLTKLQSATRKALQKSTKKRQEYKQQLQELLKRVSKLQQEKQLAVRVCEENRTAYEMKLAEMGLPVLTGRLSCGSYLDTTASLGQSAAVLRSDPSPRGPLHSRELRAISDRLEQQAAWVRERKLGTGAGPPATSPLMPNEPVAAPRTAFAADGTGTGRCGAD